MQSSEPGCLAVNAHELLHGRSRRDNANSAVIVTVTPQDYGTDHPLSGVEFQRELERRAWEEGSGCVLPSRDLRIVCANKKTVELGCIKPNIKGHYRLGNVRNIFPEELSLSIQEGIGAMDHKIRGFADKDVLLSGVESRTSSPVRINRDDSFRKYYPVGLSVR